MPITNKISTLNSTEVIRVGDSIPLVRDGETYQVTDNNQFAVEYENGSLGLTVSYDDGATSLWSPSGLNFIQVDDNTISININNDSVFTSSVEGTTLAGLTQVVSLYFANPFTPTGSDDSTGNLYSIAVDDDFIYVKTATGWASSPLTLLDPTP